MNIIIILFILCSLSFASNPQTNSMVNLMKIHGVNARGKYSELSSHFICKFKREEFLCEMIYFDENSTDNFTKIVLFKGNEAKEISELLIYFNILPIGRKLKQTGEIICQKENIHSVEMECSSVKYEEISL